MHFSFLLRMKIEIQVADTNNIYCLLCVYQYTISNFNMQFFYRLHLANVLILPKPFIHESVGLHSCI